MKTLADAILKIRAYSNQITELEKQIDASVRGDHDLWYRLGVVNGHRQNEIDRLALEVLKNFEHVSDDELRSLMEIPIVSVGIRIFEEARIDPEDPMPADAEVLVTCACGRLVKQVCAYCERCSVCGDGLSLDEHKEWACKVCLSKSEEINED